MKRHLYWLLLASLLFWQCERVFMEKDPVNDPVTNFDYLWQELDEKYSFFAYKGVDWDATYQLFRPQVSNDMSREELFYLMGEMLNTLEDGHVNLRSEFDVTKYLDYYLTRPRNFNFHLIEKNYLTKDWQGLFPLLINDLGDSIGYISYRSFQSAIADDDLDRALTRFQDMKGLIIDVRDNEGGDPANGFKLIRRLADERRLVYYNSWKSGPGPDDFTTPEPTYLGPAAGEDVVRYQGPVAILTNRFSYSAASWFAVMGKAFPHITIVGDTTGGGSGVPSGSELPNGFWVN